MERGFRSFRMLEVPDADDGLASSATLTDGPEPGLVKTEATLILDLRFRCAVDDAGEVAFGGISNSGVGVSS